MNKYRILGFLMVMQAICCKMVSAQDTLPRFTLSSRSNGKVLISWHNNFEQITQISIQRSADSLKNFTTLLSVPDPTIPENGFVDAKAPRLNMYYRLFIVLDNGKYLFSKSQRSRIDSNMLAPPKLAAKEAVDPDLPRADNQRITYLPAADRKNLKIAAPGKISDAPKIIVSHTIYILGRDSLLGSISSVNLVRFRDSVIKKTRDTLVFINADTILVKTFIPREVYRVSSYVFTSKDGNVTISLPDAEKKKYMVKFLEQDLSPILEVKEIRKPILIVDKTNFIHAGWFRFELYEEGKLKEKNKLFIPKDF